MNNPLFIDANYFCALYNKEDSLHDKAASLSYSLRDYYLVVSNFVLVETYTILSQRVSKDLVKNFRKHIFVKGNYEIVWIDQILEEKVWEIFKSIKDKNFSYVDASILAIIQKGEIKNLLSFDESFKKLEKRFNFTLIK